VEAVLQAARHAARRVVARAEHRVAAQLLLHLPALVSAKKRRH
jgi:hypothetical protein